jgi:RecX family.
VDRLDPDVEEQTARALVLRRLPSTRGLTAAARTRRLVGLLARKGYPSGVAFRVVREVLEQEGDRLDERCWLDGFEDEPQPDVEP